LSGLRSKSRKLRWAGKLYATEQWVNSHGWFAGFDTELREFT